MFYSLFYPLFQFPLILCVFHFANDHDDCFQQSAYLTMCTHSATADIINRHGRSWSIHWPILPVSIRDSHTYVARLMKWPSKKNKPLNGSIGATLSMTKLIKSKMRNQNSLKSSANSKRAIDFSSLGHHCRIICTNSSPFSISAAKKN